MGYNIFDKAMFCLLATLMIFIFWVVGLSIYQTAFSEKINLLKDEWNCSGTKTVMTNTLVGKILVPMPTKVCIQYNRK